MYRTLEAGEVLVTEDVRTDPRFPELADIQVSAGMTSSIRVPLLDHGRLAAVLAVTMAERPRVWTQDEISLVEAVAVHVRSALDIARNLIREQRISNTLQSALQPPLPPRLPGLELADFYRAALDESRIGGDFYDCLSLRNGNYALVIGDLSGKGLSAAAQVATVRNLLRGVLYVVEHLGEALTTLNRMCLEHMSLNGFVTLFATSYNPQTRDLSFVCCGHEPPLLWRGETGEVEFLNPSGPVLGISYDAHYTEGRIQLRQGDRLVLYTDGISEAGPDRRTLLGPEGLAAILRAVPAQLSAAELTDRLRAEVEARGGALRDDACLVTVVVL
jgi:serine phosphatase RsbU (regulator of sigma subunit)